MAQSKSQSLSVMEFIRDEEIRRHGKATATSLAMDYAIKLVEQDKELMTVMPSRVSEYSSYAMSIDEVGIRSYSASGNFSALPDALSKKATKLLEEINEWHKLFVEQHG